MSRIVHTDIWSAYGYAKKAGYEGTEAEFCEGLKKGAEASDHAEESASQAAEAASTATTAAGNASNSAGAAATSASEAQGFANAAAGSASDASGSAALASSKADEAGEFSASAENYAEAAAGSASDAAGSVTDAGAHASAAAQSATEAANQASAAAGSAQSASQSVTAATEQANAAAVSASDAGTLADNAAASATQASSYADTAEAWAVGTRNGSAVPSTDPAYQNSAKYWKDQAQAVKESMPLDYTTLSNDVLLQSEYIPGTTQAIVRNAAGKLTGITHTSNNNVAIRTDVFTFADDTITEVRTLHTGESLTIVVDKATLVTTVTYAA